MLAERAKDLLTLPGDRHSTPPPAQQLLAWICDLIDTGKLTIAIDGLDELAFSDGRRLVQALRRFLDFHPRVHCVVAGRPYAVFQDYWWPLFAKTRESKASDWEFCVVEVFDQAQRERVLGLKLLLQLKQLQPGLELNPRTLEVLRTLPETELAKLRTLADIYWASNYKALCLDNLKPGQDTPQIDLTPNQILSVLGAAAFLSVQGIPQNTGDGRFMAAVSRATVSKRVQQPQQRETARILPLNKRAWEILHPRIAAVCEQPDMTRQQAQELLKKLHRLGTQYVEFACITIQEIKQLKWRVTTQRDFLAALWFLRHGSQDDLHWLADKHSRVLSWPQDHPARHPELLELWRFLCGMPDDAFRIDGDKNALERWDALMHTLFNGPHATPRPTELMTLALPRLLQRAGFLQKPDWETTDVQQAMADAQQVTAAAHRNPTADLNEPASDSEQTLRLFLSEYLTFRDTREPAICREDLEDCWQDCQSAAGKQFWTGHTGQSYPVWGRPNPPQERHLTAAFQLSAVPVTRRLYALFDPRHAQDFEDYDRYSPDPRCPAIHVSHWDATMLSFWLHGRLPDEWEWEYACRGGQDRPGDRQPVWWWGNDATLLPHYAWIDENSAGKTHPVGQLPGNGFGLRDMLGNVWEHTSSVAGTDDVGRVLRGGSFLNVAFDARCSYRDFDGPSESYLDLGCRLATAAIRKP